MLEKCVRHYHILLSSAATTSPRLHCLVDHFVCLALQYFLYKNYAILLTWHAYFLSYYEVKAVVYNPLAMASSPSPWPHLNQLVFPPSGCGAPWPPATFFSSSSLLKWLYAAYPATPRTPAPTTPAATSAIKTFLRCSRSSSEMSVLCFRFSTCQHNYSLV